MQRTIFLTCISLAVVASAQQPVAPERRTEWERLGVSCPGFSFAGIASCADALFTEHPLHIAIGSLAPQNGFGAGGAFVWHWTTSNWRNSLNTDAVATPNGSWRAGAYLNFLWIRRPTIEVGNAATGGRGVHVEEQPVFRLYSENISLNKLAYFGLGPNTAEAARTYFGQRETTTGGSVLWPVGTPLHLSLYGEANSRFVDIRPASGQGSPSIGQIYNPVTAPGLLDQPPYAQFGQGVRIRPSLARGYVDLNYSAGLKEFVGSGGASPSFQRLNLDFQHTFLMYRATRSSFARDGNGPDDCSANPTDKNKSNRQCPPLMVAPPPGSTRALEGSVNLRLTINESFGATANQIPFYFQPTLGGGDINGDLSLSSFQDYRFRAPNTILFHAAVEHSVYNRWPIGVTAMVDAGKVALTRGDVDFSDLRHSYSAGLTLRAGGFPMVYLLFSWGGGEGMHTNGRADTSLLGGAARPSYY